GDHVPYAGDRRTARKRILSASLLAAGDPHDHFLYTRLAPERRRDARPERGERLGLLRAWPEVDLDHAAGDPHVGHHAERHDVAPGAGKKEGLERVVQSFAAGDGHARRLASARHKGKARTNP